MGPGCLPSTPGHCLSTPTVKRTWIAMHPTYPAAPGHRNERLLRQVNTLETLLRRGWFIEFYDPNGTRYGLPTYPYRFAPDGLLTIRQLRARGLRPGGQDIAAQIVWRHRQH